MYNMLTRNVYNTEKTVVGWGKNAQFWATQTIY